MSSKPETKFRQSQVLPFLKTLMNTWFESIQQKSINGSPDIMLCMKGRFVALELKSEEGKATDLQLYKLNQISRAGGVSFIASPGNWDYIKQQLSRLDRGEPHGEPEVKS